MQEQSSCVFLHLVHSEAEPEMSYASFQQIFVLDLVQSTCDSRQHHLLGKKRHIGESINDTGSSSMTRRSTSFICSWTKDGKNKKFIAEFKSINENLARRRREL